MEADNPLSFAVNVHRLPEKGTPVHLQPDADQRTALARLFDLVEVKSLDARLLVASWKRDGVKVTGRVCAEIVQSCVVSLEPVDARLDTEVDALFVPEGSRLARPDSLEGGEMVLDAEGADGPETFVGDTIDVGAVVQEFMALAIDPYPRKAGVTAPTSDDPDDEPRGPLYEKLSRLRREG